MLKEDWIFHRGDIYMANLNPFKGSEQGGTRPVVVIQNDIGNYFSPTIIITPLTTQTDKKKTLPTHCDIPSTQGLTAPSIALLEQIKTIDKSRVISYLGKLSFDQMEQIEKSIQVSLGMEKQIATV